MEVLSTKDLKAGETDKMTEISILKDYISERLGHTRGVKMPYAERKRLAEIAGKHGTVFFMWTGVISLKDKNLNRGWLGLFMVYPVAWPFILPELINGNNRVYYFTLVVNIRTDETKMASSARYRTAAAPMF